VLLTELVLPLLEGVDGSRIVTTGSGSYATPFFPIKFETMPSTRETFGGYNKEYCETKWLLIAYMASLRRRLEKGETSVLPVCADPGVSPTSEMWDEQTPTMRFMARWVLFRLMKTGPQAAACQVRLSGRAARELPCCLLLTARATYNLLPAASSVLRTCSLLTRRLQVHLAVAPRESLLPGGYYHSGTKEQKLRTDTEDEALWAKAAQMLRTHLPEELHQKVAKVLG
jgi:NAD(P)-dependent dehydrogenase (short-subunit alcohol dehydrogenase family)